MDGEKVTALPRLVRARLSSTINLSPAFCSLGRTVCEPFGLLILDGGYGMGV